MLLFLSRSVRKIDRSVLGSPRVVLGSDRYGDVSTSGCQSIPLPIAHPQSRVGVCRVQVQRSMRHYVSRLKVGVILRQPCGSSSSAARRDGPADALRLAARILRLGTDQCIVQTLVVALAMVMRHEFSSRFPHRALAEQDHPLQTRFLDRPYKPFRVRVQNWDCAVEASPRQHPLLPAGSGTRP